MLKFHHEMNGGYCFRLLMKELEFINGNINKEGFCILCGELADGVAPTTRGCTCSHCGKPGVYGFIKLLEMDLISLN